MVTPTRLACRTILFDCDGVLVDSDASVVRAWTRWARTYGLEPEVVLPMVHGRRAADTVALLVAPSLRAEAAARIDVLELEDAATVVAVPGARELVAGLPDGSWAVVTSGTRALAGARLRAAGLGVPDVFVTADDVVAGKPAPDGYAAAARRLGCPPHEAVVLEDAGAGVLAARAAGVGAVVGVGTRALATDADVVVADLRALTWVDGVLSIDPRDVLAVPDAPDVPRPAAHC